MADESLTELAAFDLPFGRRALLRELRYESGLRMVRLVLREGRRITQVDIDEATAAELGAALIAAAHPAAKG